MAALAVTDPEQKNREEHERLVAAATNGEKDAVEQLLVRHLADIEAFVRRHQHLLMAEREPVSDYVQSVCREALQAIDKSFRYEGPGQFVNWLHQIALAKMMDKLRHHLAAKRSPQAEVCPTTLGEFVATFVTPSRDAVAREELVRMGRAYNQLEERQQHVIFLSRVRGLPHAEIGQLLGCSEEASKKLLSRAIAKLRVQTTEPGDDPPV